MDQGTQRLIKRHNAQMRDLIVRDIDALEDKLNVKRQVATKVDGAVDTVKGKLGMKQDTTTGSWGTFAKGNAVPLAAVGLGGAMLAKNLQARATAATTSTPQYSAGVTVIEPEGSSSGGIREQVSGTASAVTDKASGAKDAVAGRASAAKDVVTDRASAATGAVSEHASHAKDVIVDHVPSPRQVVGVAKDHGQVLGMAALAAGALAGAFMPRTQAEEAKLAPLQSQARDKASELVDQAKEMAQDKVETVQEAVSAGVETAKDTLDEGNSDDGEELGSDTGYSSDMRDLTQPNRITGSRDGVTEPFSAGPSTS